MTTLCLSHKENEKRGFKKYINVVSKEEKEKKHHQMKN